VVRVRPRGHRGRRALLIAGTAHVSSRAVVLDAPNQVSIGVNGPRGTACEGPITSPHSIGSVRVWAAAVDGPGTLAVSIRDVATGRALARGGGDRHSDAVGVHGRFNEKVLAGRSLSVCVLIDGPASISLLGSATQDPAIQVRLAGRRTPSEFALALLRPQRSLLSLLPVAFSRASLFRPGCVGRGPSGVSLLGYWRPSRSARPQSQPPPVRTNMRAVMGAAHPSSGSSAPA
jgi:hypothetical protein